jgi:hypothetical protein
MPQPTTYNDSFTKGDDYDLSWVMYEVDANGVRTPMDLTGTTGAGKIRSSPDQTGSLIATFTFVNTSLANGIPIFNLPAATTTTLTPGDYFYDLELTIDGKKRTWVAGKITILPQVTD